MRLLYINADLARPRSLPGIRGARLVSDLRALGAKVIAYPAVGNPNGRGRAKSALI
jgi:hypothetical protein